jgi:hypothetical protein
MVRVSPFLRTKGVAMKLILAAAVAVALVGLVAVGPVALGLVVMIAPLVILAMASGWGLAHGAGGAIHRRQPKLHGRHVVNRDATR